MSVATDALVVVRKSLLPGSQSVLSNEQTGLILLER